MWIRAFGYQQCMQRKQYIKGACAYCMWRPRSLQGTWSRVAKRMLRDTARTPRGNAKHNPADTLIDTWHGILDSPDGISAWIKIDNSKTNSIGSHGSQLCLQIDHPVSEKCKRRQTRALSSRRSPPSQISAKNDGRMNRAHTVCPISKNPRLAMANMRWFYDKDSAVKASEHLLPAHTTRKKQSSW